ncbi:MAG: hypothetical protein NTX50_32120 [Candidatus Sumerlaeota bacterium]|nr:hypothetical protein [Candidatus Sumerlaeota bacterium]
MFVSEYCHEHRKAFSVRSPDLSRMRSKDEVSQAATADGLLEFAIPPAKEIVKGIPPTSHDDKRSGATKYLWVVAKANVPIALEHPSKGTTLSGERLTHTNLTGGADAHTAGEIWFIDPTRIAINGGSSRYTPRSKAELDSVTSAFEAAGYRVVNMGWDEESGKPLRYLEGELTWER